jgi:hypothetical protein
MSEIVSSSPGSVKGDDPMRCVRDVTGAVAEARKLLCRDELAKLGGAALRGRYGGGGSEILSLSENGFGGGGLRSLAAVTETTSDVSMPVKYAPSSPEGIGPSIIGCVKAGSGGGGKRLSLAVYSGNALDGGAM